jgi:hypothetical protein
MSEGSGSGRHNSQRESPVNEGDVGPVSQRIGESSQPMISSAQMQEILHRWYNIGKDFLFYFPEHFIEVPAMELDETDELQRSHRTTPRRES